MSQDWTKLVADLERLLKLRAIPFGMKLFERREEMEAIPRIRRPKAVHTLDQIVAQAARLGWTVGLTSEDLVGAQCRAVVGLGRAKDDKWLSGEQMVGVWYSTPEDARAHQAALQCVPDGRYEALAVAPLGGGRTRSARHRAVLRDAGCDDLLHQRLAMVGLQVLRLEHRRRVRLCGFLGSRAQDPGAEPVDPVLCRAPLRGRARRRDAYGLAARLSRQGDRRHGSARQERPALPIPAIWHPAGCPRRHGGELPGPGSLRKRR